MRILGIHDGHNASVALFEDGRIRYAMQEERLVREKNRRGFPRKALEHLLSVNKLSPGDFDFVGLGSHFQDRNVDVPLATLIRRVYSPKLTARVKRRLTQMSFYKRYRTQATKSQRLEVARSIRLPIDRLHFVDHHRAHAATAYFGMREDEGDYLVLTLDGSGDWLCSTAWKASAGKMKLLASTGDEHSLGYMYATVTRLMGFLPLEHEYKIMGLAAYCPDSIGAQYADIFSKYLGLDPQNPMRFKKRTRTAMPFIGPHLQKAMLGIRFDYLCGGLQLFTERLIVDWVTACIRTAGLRRVIVGGGVFMNVKANKRLMELPEVEWLAISPSCGDETLSLGCCYDLASRFGVPVCPLKDFYLGNDISEEECRRALDNSNGFKVERPRLMADRVAELLARGEVVARAAGRMEFGARALGNRSILADPSNADVVRVINRKIKNRDFWMPFAPAALKHNADELCANARGLPSPYMMLTFDTRQKYRRDLIAGLHSSDFTARLQIVEPGSNPEYEAILEAFERKTGRKALLNTSFNLHGNPIVCNATDALQVFAGSELEWLVLGPFLIHKN